MPTTHFQNALFARDIEIGESSSTDVTVVRGQPVYAGADADSNANRMIPVTDISAHSCNGLSQVATADVVNGVAKMALFPMTIMTDNVASGAVPTATADARVYINDSGEFTNADGGGSSVSYGVCLEVKTSGQYSGMYVLQLTGPDFDT